MRLCTYRTRRTRSQRTETATRFIIGYWAFSPSAFVYTSVVVIRVYTTATRTAFGKSVKYFQTEQRTRLRRIQIDGLESFQSVHDSNTRTFVRIRFLCKINVQDNVKNTTFLNPIGKFRNRSKYKTRNYKINIYYI